MVNSEISEISNSTIIEVRDVYYENIFSFKSRVLFYSSCTLSTSNIPSSNSTPPTDIEPRRSKRTKVHKNFREDFFTYFIKGDPSSITEAMDSSKSLFWKKKSLTIRSNYNGEQYLGSQ